MTKPKGQLLLRTVAMPANTNANGDIFGGWIMSQLDLAGAILAKELSNGRVVTVSVDGIHFLSPVRVGDVVCCYGECTRIGRTSMTVELEVWIKSIDYENVGEPAPVCRATFNYVAIDANHKPRPIPEKARFDNHTTDQPPSM
jgi:acyl-CoA thioesterase YciA